MGQPVWTSVWIWPWPEDESAVAFTRRDEAGNPTEEVTFEEIREEIDGHLLNGEAAYPARARWRGKEIQLLIANGEGNYGTATFTEDGVTQDWEDARLNYTLGDDGDVEWSAHEYLYVDGKLREYDTASGGPALDHGTFRDMLTEAELLAGDRTAEVVGAKVIDWFAERTGKRNLPELIV